MCEQHDATDKTKVIFVNPPRKIMWRGWLKPKEARQYAGGIDKRTWQAWKRQGLRVQIVGGVLLTRPEWVDAFILNHKSNQTNENLAREMIKGVKE